MKKDIKFLPVENVAIAIAKQKNEINEDIWNVYLINKNDFALENVFVNSKGYGTFKGEEQQTSVLRHHFERIETNEFILVEPIDPGVFHLNNEYWISYFVGGQIYDKKFIFLQESIVESNLILIPELNMKGILHH